ncbi:MAG: ORF6N domain-containing protein [Desulfobacterales bacterium]
MSTRPASFGEQTRVLKQAVRRNSDRFPTDFMFELTRQEFENLRSQIVTSSWGGLGYLSMAFTEQGLMIQTASVRK